MLSSEGLPRPVIRSATVTRRFQKFLLVGAIGLGVNQGALFALVDQAGLAVAMASPIAIFLSMIVTFTLNERWTWHDRGQGRVLHRALLYGSINSGGLLINWLTLVSLHRIGPGLPDCQPYRRWDCRGLELQPESRAHLAPVIDMCRSAFVGTARLSVPGAATGLAYTAGREAADSGRRVYSSRRAGTVRPPRLMK